MGTQLKQTSGRRAKEEEELGMLALHAIFRKAPDVRDLPGAQSSSHTVARSCTPTDGSSLVVRAIGEHLGNYWVPTDWKHKQGKGGL